MFHRQNLFLSNSVATIWKRFVHNGAEAIFKLQLDFYYHCPNIKLEHFMSFDSFKILKICRSISGETTTRPMGWALSASPSL